MKVRRNVSSIPLRTAAATWQRIVDLITGPGSEDTEQLDAATSVVTSIIADEHLAKCPLILSGCGPRLVMYCLYGAYALEVGEEVDALTWNPTEGDWWMLVPCDEENIDWVQTALAERAPRLKAYGLDEVPADLSEEAEGSQAIHVDWGVLE